MESAYVGMKEKRYKAQKGEVYGNGASGRGSMSHRKSNARGSKRNS